MNRIAMDRIDANGLKRKPKKCFMIDANAKKRGEKYVLYICT